MPFAIAILISLIGASAAQASPSGVVVSEFRTRGPAGGSDEFIELRNTSSAPVSIAGWRLQGCASGSGAAGDRATVPAATTLDPAEHWLFTNDSTSGGPYSGPVAGDQTYSSGISDTGGLRILDTSGAVQDGAGTNTSPCREGVGLGASFPALNSANNAFRRKAGETQDTDSNQVDFDGPQASDPDASDGGGPPPGPTITRINQIQGTGFVSPIAGQTVTIEGVVTGIDNEKGASFGANNTVRTFRGDKGIYVQEEAADQDADPQTSEGIFVGFVDNPTAYPPGTKVRLNGLAKEQFGFTQIDETIDQEPQNLGTAPVPAVTTVSEPTAESQAVTVAEGGCGFPSDACTNGRRAYYETLEGMLVALPLSTANSGGTNKFGELFLTPGPERDRVIRTDERAGPGGTPDAGIRSLIATDGDGGALDPANPLVAPLDSPTVTEADLFDTVSGARGPLNFSFSNYKVVVQPGTLPTVADVGVAYPYDRLPAPGPRELRISSFNLENFFPPGGALDGETVSQADYDEKRRRIADAIGRLQKRPDVVAVQEVVNIQVLQALATELGGYTAYLEEGNDNRGIDVGFLVKDSLVASNARQFGKSEPNPTSETCSDISGRLFDRPPLAIDIETADGAAFTIFSNHFSSKAAPDACRVAQARFVRAQVKELTEEGRQAIVAGDLNAFEDEAPLTELQDPGETSLTNLWDRAPADDRYSFQFSGRLQTLDHILITDGLEPRFEGFQYAHFDNDYYDRQDPNDGHKVSDHDPPVLTIRADAQSCASAGAITDNSPGDIDPDTGEITGGPGDDFIKGGDGNDYIQGGGGEDLLCGQGGNDTILDGAGADRSFGENGNDVLGAGTQSDRYSGGSGGDRVSYATRSTGVTARIGGGAVSGEDGEDDTIDPDVEDLNGSRGADELSGASPVNILTGGPGADTIFGLGGNDRIRGGEGDDPELDGGPGNDTIEGQTGTDSLIDGEGADLLLGGDGDGDQHTLSIDSSRDEANCGPGTGDRAVPRESVDRANRNCEVRE